MKKIVQITSKKLTLQMFPTIYHITVKIDILLCYHLTITSVENTNTTSTFYKS